MSRASANTKTKLILIKLLLTAIWLFYVFTILYILYASIVDKIDFYFLVAVSLVLIEGAVLLIT